MPMIIRVIVLTSIMPSAIMPIIILPSRIQIDVPIITLIMHAYD